MLKARKSFLSRALKKEKKRNLQRKYLALDTARSSNSDRDEIFLLFSFLGSGESLRRDALNLLTIMRDIQAA